MRQKNGFDKGRKWQPEKSIFAQFLVVVTGLLICMIVSFILTNYVVRNLTRRNTEITNMGILQQIDAKTAEFHNSMYNMLTLLSYEQTTYDYFRQSKVERLNSHENLISLLSTVMMAQNDIAGVALYDEKMNKLADVGKNFEVFGKVKLEKKMAYSDVFRPNSSSEACFMISYPVYDLLYGNYDRQLGMIVVLMRAGKFSSYMENTEITENEKLFLVDTRNMVIAGSKKEECRQLDEYELTGTDENYVCTIDQKETGWKIVSLIPQKELYSGMSIVRTSILVIYLVMMSGLILLLFFCYFIVLRPIRKVDVFVRNSVANPTKRLEVTGADEISVLSGNLNHMLDEKDEISEQLRQAQRVLYETALAKQQMQVLAYRNQINPHFLYNTFECIRAMALYYDADEIAEITMALSKIFRYAIKGKDVVTVNEEVANIREYARIIHYRFGGKIRVEIDVEEEAGKKEIIKLILQPIVENSIFHGLEQKLEDGMVRISARCIRQGKLELVVEDDGCGMEQSQVDRLLYQMKRQSLNHSSAKDSIGLANIYQRLMLFYGENAAFRIKSRPGAGTRMEIVVPCREETEHV